MKDDPQDGWGLKGIRLRGKCSNSTIKWEVGKFANLKKWLERPEDSCDRFDKLKLSIVRGPHEDGYQDRVFIGFEDEGKQQISLQTHEGWQNWQDINIREIWDAPIVGLDEITQIHIKQLHKYGNLSAIQSFKLKGSCAGSNSLIEYGLKFEGLDQQTEKTQEYNHPGTGVPSHTIWRTNINAKKDWILLHDCTRFDKLDVSVGISGYPGSGTEDSLYISFARDKTLAPDQLVKAKPWPGNVYSIQIDLKEIFGTDTIYIQDIHYFRIFARKEWWLKRVPDWWKVTNVIFEARCADDHSKVLQNEQYRGVEKQCDALAKPWDQEVEGPIYINSWHWKDDKIASKVKIRTHDGNEF
ncbi:hypothetical protein CDD81_6496 [Ophiocordyceps australis]|uniref:Uncharacterized protein n=1 Tax=Ophiocordyceps australis TaxID=1399860 RepID=A0A2C5XBY8_9HYPO|nr:hypothetical protein CDD81_6496 [Ophiocordyceps australis]